MIILFGSYARWDFVESDRHEVDGHIEEYKSDFDILVVNRKPSQERNLRHSTIINQNIEKLNISTPTNILVEDIKHINQSLSENRYFYYDIKRDGITLYNNKKCKLSSAKKLSYDEQKKLQTEDFNLWFKSAKIIHQDFINHYKSDPNDQILLNIMAFYLHQATERYITAYILVKTWYKPKTHDLWVLYETIKKQDSIFNSWFDLNDDHENDLFELLRRAYVEARYSKEYQISKLQLKELGKKVATIRDYIDDLCRAIIG
jgi:HEPN domain-containing protein/predicted nucleotidyltransferase